MLTTQSGRDAAPKKTSVCTGHSSPELFWRAPQEPDGSRRDNDCDFWDGALGCDGFRGDNMYTVTVRSHMMIAHSFRGELFGPAQKLHGATYVVDVAFQSDSLSDDGVVLDIGRAIQALEAVLADFNYKNLDEDPVFEGQNTTTEFMAKVVFERLLERMRRGELGPGSERVSGMKVTLNESHVAAASYEAPCAG